MFERIRSLFGLDTRASLADPGSLALFGGMPTAGGIDIGPFSALHSPATLAAIRLIAETVGALPCQIFERGPDGSRQRTDSHPAAALLAGDWCPWASSTETRTQLQFDALQHGTGYAVAVRVAGQVRELHRLDPAAVTAQHDSATLEPSFRVRYESGPEMVLPWQDVVCIRVPGATINRPINLVSLAREAIALDIAMARFQGRLFGKSARPAGVLEYSKMLTEQMVKRLRESIDSRHAGSESAGTMILEDGMKFTQTQFSSVDLQFLELRRFAIQEIARVFKVPVTFLGDLERGTWKNLEELSRQFVTFCLLPWLDQWQSALSRVLIAPADRARFFIEFQTADLLRGDIAARYAALRNAVGGSWLVPNEARRLENLPPIEGGDALIKQAGQSGAIPAPADGGDQ